MDHTVAEPHTAAHRAAQAHHTAAQVPHTAVQVPHTVVAQAHPAHHLMEAHREEAPTEADRRADHREDTDQMQQQQRKIWKLSLLERQPLSQTSSFSCSSSTSCSI